MAKRLKGMGQAKYQRDGDPRTSGPGFGVTEHPHALDAPVKWRAPERIFVNSMSDLFHPQVSDGFIARVWEVMAQAPQHTYMILTKRPKRMRSWLKRWHDTTGDEQVRNQTGSSLPPMPRGPEAVRAVYNSPRARLFADMLDNMGTPPDGAAYPLYDWMEGPRWFPGVLDHVWCGVSVEDQKTAEERIPILADTPASIRFVSAEPLLAPVDLLGDEETPGPAIVRNMVTWDSFEYGLQREWDDQIAIDWLICGGESGVNARPFDLDWARSLRDQCTSAGIAFFFKQIGGRTPKANGRMLDGREWSDFPTRIVMA